MLEMIHKLTVPSCTLRVGLYERTGGKYVPYRYVSLVFDRVEPQAIRLEARMSIYKY